VATEAAIAILREKSLKRLTVAMHTIGNTVQVDPVQLPEFNHDRNYLHATQLETLANWAESVAYALVARGVPAVPSGGEPTPETETSEGTGEVQPVGDVGETALVPEAGGDEQTEVVFTPGAQLERAAQPDEAINYNALTVTQLKELAEREGIDLGGATRKDEIITAIRTADTAE
jgi:hypothetical protein